jgi:hypothetical protein
VVFAAVVAALDHWGAAELAAPDDERVFQQPAMLFLPAFQARCTLGNGGVA